MKINANEMALVIVDMQKYYLDSRSPFWQYSVSQKRDSMDYIRDRCRSLVIPQIRRVRELFENQGWPVVFLRLCTRRPDGSDLHRFFQQTNETARAAGFGDVYPHASDHFAQVIDELTPRDHELIINKGNFSPFTDTQIEPQLRSLGIKTLVMTGLATSQCVDTTARDASERDFNVIQLADAQADYDEASHNASLFASVGVCGGNIMNTEAFLEECPGPTARTPL